MYPYLLKGLAIARANQVWCTDITYIPVRHGFLYPGGDHGLGGADTCWPGGFEHPGRPCRRRRFTPQEK